MFTMELEAPALMTNGFINVPDTESLDRFLSQSEDGPVIVLKHSNTCGISSRAYAEMSGLGRRIGLVTVQHARAVSDELEKRTGIAHETPQLFIFRKGEAIWSASHGQIKAEAVKAALAEINKGAFVSEARS
jgi:bacillithiol system protein YtxJ